MKHILLGVLFFTSGLFLSAQSLIKGTVESEDGEPLIGVTIQEKGQSGGTVTDFDGKFQLEVSSLEASLLLRYLGFEDLEEAIKGQTTLSLVMRLSASQLDEVTVTALGIKRQKRELGYSTESFDGEDLAKSTAPNVLSALSGKSAGVQIIQPNGVEGGTSRITIRGNNNISSNNQPLIVVDGVPLENPAGLDNVGRGVDWGSPINNINPEDIESMNVLKGPTAAALYGSRGANGVILITTKRGKSGKGLGVQYSLTHKVIQPFRYRSVQNKYGAGGPNQLTTPVLELNDAGEYKYPLGTYVNDGPFGKPTTELFGFYSTGVSWGPEMQGQMVRWWDGELRPFDPQPDNLKAYFKNGRTTTHNVAFSGGNDLGTIRVSLTSTDHDAVVPNSTYQQNTANLGARVKLSEKVTADVSMNYIDYGRLNSPSLGDDNESSFGKGILYSWPRSYKGLEQDINILPDGTRNDYGGNYPFTFSPPNLWWNTYHRNTTLKRDKLIGSISLNYQITPWLLATGRTGLDFSLDQFETRHDPVDNLGIEEGFYSNELLRDRVQISEFLVSAYKDKFLDSAFNLKLSFGGTKWQRRLYGIKGESGEWANPRLFALNNYADQLSVPLPSEQRFNKDINSLYSFLNVSFRNYLFLELTARNDWSSSLPINNNSYFYPAASLSWIVTEAVPMNWGAVNFLKLRAAFAQTGSDTEPFQLDFIYDTGSFGNVQSTSLPSTIPAIELKPQRANSYELGISAGIWEDKINLDFTWYNISSYDQILQAPLPLSSGAPQFVTNAGELRNRGWEASLSCDVWAGRKGYFRTAFNINRNRNHVLDLGDGAQILELADIWDLNGPAIAVEAGQEYGTIVGYDYVYHENGERIVNDEGTHYEVTEDRVPIGNASPDFIAGWNSEIKYKNFRLSLLADAKIGGDVYAGSYVIGLQTGQSPETLLERDGGGLPYTDPDEITSNIGVILEGVHADGTPNEEVVHYLFKYIPNAGGWGRFLSSPGVLDNTWVKMREVSLSYQLPSSIARKLKAFQNLELSLVGRDLFYIYTSLPDNINPEGNNGSGNAQGLEWASYPGMRSFSFRVQAKF